MTRHEVVPPRPKGFDTPGGWMTYEEYRERMDALEKAEDPGGFFITEAGAEMMRQFKEEDGC